MQYSPLDPAENEIRLLEIDLPGSHSNNISCRMHKVSLRSSQPQYTALSYLWGNTVLDCTIDIGWMKVRVTSSLFDALNSVIRHYYTTYTQQGKALYLWADQVCINQKDDNEKNHQVGYMRTIYSRAETVLVRLPDSPQSTDIYSGPYISDWQVLSTWLQARVKSKRERLPFFHREGGLKSPYDMLQANIIDMLVAWSEVLEIVESPWWSRVWVFQECILAERATFLIRRLAIPWRNLQQLITFFHMNVQQHIQDLDGCKLYLSKFAKKYKGNRYLDGCKLYLSKFAEKYKGNRYSDERNAAQKVLADISAGGSYRVRLDNAPWHFPIFILQQRLEANRMFSLSSLMLHAQLCGSTDARDKVFAFLGLADPEYGIQIDYAASNTVEEVSIEAATAIIQHENSLELLLGAIEYRAAYHPLPSWVPNLAATATANSEYRKFLHGIGFQRAKLGPPTECRAALPTFEADRTGRPNRVLVVSGRRIDILSKVVEDNQDQPWRRFSKTRDNNHFIDVLTRNTARIGDEVWMLDGLTVPLVLTRPDLRDEYRTIVGHAIVQIRYDGKTSTIDGSASSETFGEIVSVSIV